MARLKTLRPRIAELDTRRVKPPPKTGDPFYDSQPWRALVARLLSLRGRRCEDPTCPTPRGPWRRVYADHIVELSDGGAPLDPANVMLRCPTCHGRKTAAARVRRFSE
jgi:5-methylcytosine-specific restriction protein A